MKYLIPDFLLALFIITFTNDYVIACTYILKNIYSISNISLFKYTFLAFPSITILILSIFGIIRQSIIEKYSPAKKSGNFVRENLIFIIVAIAFALQIFEAINEPTLASPVWITKIGKIQLLFNLAGLFCISSIFVHILFQLKRIFINRSI